MPAPFEDRSEAGEVLANKLAEYAHRPDVLVLGLPRGGVPVAYEVARGLDAPLDVFLVRKLGVPRHEELAMGAIASGGIMVLNDDIVRSYSLGSDTIEKVRAAEQQVLERRERLYRDDQPHPSLSGKTLILVDDGLATGATMLAAVQAVRQENPARVVVAVPVGAQETVAMLQRFADQIVCVLQPEPFYAVGMWYVDFSPTTDDDVRHLLERAAHVHS